MWLRFGRADLAAWAAALWVTSAVPWARAQDARSPSDNDLAMARSLFAEALRDEDAKHYVDALQKFRRVRSVRDTAPVEYRIGACYDGLGQSVPAYEAYRKAAQMGQRDTHSGDVVAAAIERLRALEKHVARLTLALPELAPPDAEVRIDDRAVSRAALGEEIVLDPGPHVVIGSASDSPPTRTEIVLPEGAQLSLTIPFDARTHAPPAAPTSSAVVALRAAEAPPDSIRPAPPPSAARTAGWVMLAGGGAFVASSAVVFVVRSGDIAKLDQACPAGSCPQGSNRADLESTRSRALVEGPVSGALVAAGAAAVGLGAYLLLRTRNGRPDTGAGGTSFVPFLGAGVAGFVASGRFR